MQADIRRVGEILANSEDVLILTHKNPDGDCLGTGAALCRYLLSLGKRATVVNADPIPSKSTGAWFWEAVRWRAREIAVRSARWSAW